MTPSNKTKGDRVAHSAQSSNDVDIGGISLNQLYCFYLVILSFITLFSDGNSDPTSNETIKEISNKYNEFFAETFLASD